MSTPQPASSVIPEQQQFINGLSASALFGTPVFAFGNRLWFWGVVSLLPFISIVASLYLLFAGRRASWNRGGWQGFDAFKARQSLIAKIVVILIIAAIVLSVLFGALSANMSN